ncbi:dihydrofolate reductase family protein [Cryptosporangium aurantiacum]|uniref:Dihydrofolate reductase n=1 Tax=Cryptosporangium aurantiacum TaxID=134849 RepID=A0A1M7RL42_9ACTN|nr:dihydrofolate reductase family protein [Cryptosporangium aurantiacum]SHN47027.1 Dihydrofolate reductase [Cryptosporangium aurantiacum]
MGKLLYGATMSLDGFIAGPKDDVSWLTEFLGPDPVADELVANVGSCLIGARTFRGDDPNAGTDQEGPFGGAWQGPQFVLTHTPPDEPVPDVTFVGDLRTGIDLSKAAAGDGYVCIIGADVARQCLELGEVDEVLVFVAPILLGDGVRLFSHLGGTKIRLDPPRVHETPNATSLWYSVRR